MDFFIIAGEELVTGFRFAGVLGQEATDRSQALEAFGSPACRAARVVIIEGSCADLIRDEVSSWEMTGQFPLVVELPPWGGPALGGRRLVDLIREAVGLPV